MEEDAEEQDVTGVGVEWRQKSCLLRWLGCRCQAPEVWRRNPNSGKATVLVHSPGKELASLQLAVPVLLDSLPQLEFLHGRGRG